VPPYRVLGMFQITGILVDSLECASHACAACGSMAPAFQNRLNYKVTLKHAQGTKAQRRKGRLSVESLRLHEA